MSEFLPEENQEIEWLDAHNLLPPHAFLTEHQQHPERFPQAPIEPEQQPPVERIPEAQKHHITRDGR